MSIKIYNTLTNRKEKLKPFKNDRIGMYVCGITAYDFCHIGHARSAVIFDLIYRYLKFRDYKVTYVRNYTDIDDKIINRAKSEGIDYREISERYIKEFDRDMDELKIQVPDVTPRATKNIKEIINIVNLLIEKGYAYNIEGDVYFSVEKFKSYGKLSGKNIEELKSGARIEIDERKKNPLDFALWKKSKDGEPYWDSPWSKGRPGWHIECSAMSQKHLGDTFDIHGGGMDLIFPHHENEIAQSEAATGEPFVNYWIHNGFVNIDQEKMSKSLGNITTIKEILKKYHPEALRLFLLSHHYRSPVDYSEKQIEKSEATLDRFYNFLLNMDKIINDVKPPIKIVEPHTAKEKKVYEKVIELKEKFISAMDDDFNSAKALGYFFDTMRMVNIYLSDISYSNYNLFTFSLINIAKYNFNSLAKVFGIFDSNPEVYKRKKMDKKLPLLSLNSEEIEALIKEREKARKEKNWDKADAIRSKLASQNIIIKDTPQGSIWEVR
jgi:cysteinyl-tRNA synthetase